MGRTDLAGLDLLDVGCGVRFTQTLINRALPFASYTGIEVYQPIINWLREHVETHDDRFSFVHWNVQNSMYNPRAQPMSTYERLPVTGHYDVIMGFSLFTHLDRRIRRACCGSCGEWCGTMGISFSRRFAMTQ